MEIKLDDLKDYVGLPIWDGKFCRVIESVTYIKGHINITFTDKKQYSFHKGERTRLRIAVQGDRNGD